MSKITGVDPGVSSLKGTQPPKTVSDVKIDRKPFKDWLEQTTGSDLLGNDLFRQLNQAQKGLVGRTELSPRELLNYQILAGQFGLRVELVSKIGESLMSTARKFQTNQG